MYNGVKLRDFNLQQKKNKKHKTKEKLLTVSQQCENDTGVSVLLFIQARGQQKSKTVKSRAIRMFNEEKPRNNTQFLTFFNAQASMTRRYRSRTNSCPNTIFSFTVPEKIQACWEAQPIFPRTFLSPLITGNSPRRTINSEDCGQQEKTVTTTRETSHLATRTFRHWSIRHQEFFDFEERTIKHFHKIIVANCFMAILRGGEMNINQLHHQIPLSCFRFASSVYISLDLIITIVSFQLLVPVILDQNTTLGTLILVP